MKLMSSSVQKKAKELKEKEEKAFSYPNIKNHLITTISCQRG